jgi:hypothetical protein
MKSTTHNNYSNPKWFVEAHSFGVRFHKPQKSTNDLGLLYTVSRSKCDLYPSISSLSATLPDLAD